MDHDQHTEVDIHVHALLHVHALCTALQFLIITIETMALSFNMSNINMFEDSIEYVASKLFNTNTSILRNKFNHIVL